ncbi:RNA polymerase sigma factor [Algihabitans albus]|uniref:RNA polymerase sigma factor n=1 Tax=Algihabitans albus TaxID=2164067 RepID=UPI0013C35A9D|nr:sigma-70 family RNA polymerase sigma factor [Algihabitans albus]
MSGDPHQIKQLVRGDKPAWDGFVADTAAVVYAAVQKRLVPAGRGDEADDVVQEVYLKLCRNDYKLLRGYDPGKAKITTFLTVIATTTAIDTLRRGRPTGVHAEAIDDVPEYRLAVDPVEPVQPVRIPEGLLSERQAAVLRMLYDEEKDVAEAATLLGVEAQTVRSMHHKALTKLRQHFAEVDKG